MSAIEYDLIIFCGETLDSTSLELAWKLNDTPVNLTGYTARAQGRAQPNPAASLLFDWSTANGKLAPLGIDGVFFNPNVSATETAALWKPTYPIADVVKGRQAYLAGAWDIEIMLSGTVKRMVQGRVLVVPEVIA